MTKLIAPKLRVSVEQLDGGPAVEYDVQTDNRDMIRWERAAAKHGWPALKDAPLLWMTHLSYTALSRSGVPTGSTFDAYADRVIGIETLDENDQPAAANDPDALAVGGFPTQPEVASAYASSLP